MHEELKSSFEKIAQADINILEKEVKKVENRIDLTILVLMGISAITLYAKVEYNLPTAFVVIIGIFVVIGFILSPKVFRINYKESIEQIVFPKILEVIDCRAMFLNKMRDENVLDSNLFDIYNKNKSSIISLSYMMYGNRAIDNIWEYQTEINETKVNFSSHEIYVMSVHGIKSTMQRGLLVAINNSFTLDNDSYIYTERLFPLLKVASNVKKQYTATYTENKKHVIVTQDSKTNNILTELAMLLKDNMSLSISNNKVYVLIENEFDFFDKNSYQHGKIPQFSDYIGLIKSIELVEKLLLTKNI